MSPATRPDRRRASRVAARKTQTSRPPAPSGRPAAARPRPAPARRGGSFLNTFIIALLVVLAVMLAAALLILYRFVL